MSENEMADWIDRERNARRFHADCAGEMVQLWLSQFNISHSNLSRVNGMVLSQKDRFMVGLLASSLNSMMCVYKLAMDGYFTQAMNLSRILAEIPVTFWYLYLFPEEYHRFNDHNQRDPRFNDMTQKIESYQIESHPDDTAEISCLKSAIQISVSATKKFVNNSELHKFSHVSSFTIPMIIQQDQDGGTSMALGPYIDEGYCYGVFHDTLPLVDLIRNCTQAFLVFIGLD